MDTSPSPKARPAARWDEIADLFGLGRPTGLPAAVVGGWSHHLWRLETTAGSFAVKELVETSGDWWAERLEGAIELERAAWAAGTIPMAEPVSVVGSTSLVGELVGVGGVYRYRCHRWVEGIPCIELAPSLAASANIGTSVASIAALGLHGGSTATASASVAVDMYDSTVEEATNEALDWAGDLRRLRPVVDELRSDLAELARRAEPMLVMHRDVDPKNACLRSDGAVAVFDWDYSGPVLPGAELLRAALSFARRRARTDPVHRGGPIELSEACVEATVRAYEATAGQLPEFRGAAGPVIEEGFRWLMLNARRALGHEEATPEKARIARTVVISMCSEWPTWTATVRTWAERLG